MERLGKLYNCNLFYSDCIYLLSLIVATMPAAHHHYHHHHQPIKGHTVRHGSSLVHHVDPMRVVLTYLTKACEFHRRADFITMCSCTVR